MTLNRSAPARRAAFARLLLLTPVMTAVATPAWAEGVSGVEAQQTPTVPVAEPVVTPPADDAEEAVDDTQADDSKDTNEIVVMAPRLHGSVATNIPADVTLDADAISNLGVTSISELLSAIESQTRSGRGRGGGGPVMLLNGRRISGWQALRNIPPEAIQRTEVFPEEVALQYGYAADQRVVNIVLKPRFSQVSGSGDVLVATRGGYGGFEVDVSSIAITPDQRLNLGVEHTNRSMLTEAERGVIQPDGSLAGLGLVRSLIGSSDTTVTNGSWQKYLSDTTDMTLSGGWTRTTSDRLLGYGVPVLATGPVPVIMRDAASDQYTLGTIVNGQWDQWRWSLTGNWSATNSDTLTNRGTFRDTTESHDQRLDATGTISGTLLTLPAGRMTGNAAAEAVRLDYDGVSRAASGITRTNLGRTTLTGRVSVSVPVLDDQAGLGETIGRVGLNLSAAASDMSDFGGLFDWTAAVDWEPLDGLSLMATRVVGEAAPSMQQLGAAQILTPSVTYLDLTTGQTVAIDVLSGGNPNLLVERRRDWKLGARYSPPNLKDLAIQVEYNRTRSNDVASAFPLLTPAIEAAFPERVTRGIDGTFLAIDTRPVNYAAVASSNLRWGFSFGRTLSPPNGAAGAGGGRPGGAGAPGGVRPAMGSGPRPGGGMGRGGMMGPGGRWQIGVYHTIALDSTVLIRPGVPLLDLLNGDGVSGDEAIRHKIDVDGLYARNGGGVRFTIRHDRGSRIAGGSLGTLRFEPLTAVNVHLFKGFLDSSSVVKNNPWMKGLRFRISAVNLLDQRRTVRDSSGTVPLRYQPAYMDPAGRTIEFSVRKTF